MNTKDRFLGCMLGAAVGDAMGFPVEFMRVSGIRSCLGPEGVTGFDSLERLPRHRFPIGFYSDDTQMTLATARSLLKSDPTNLDDIMTKISQEYAQWVESPENVRAPGFTCTKGALNLLKGISWRKSGVSGDGCGAAMRTAPIGLLFYNDIHPLLNTARAASRCTHKDPTPSEAGVATAYIIGDILRNGDFESYNAQDVYKNVCGLKRDPKLTDKIEEVKKALENPHQVRAMNMLGDGFSGHTALALSLYSFLKNPENFRNAILTGTNINGDSDSVASIAGAISGAYNGIQAIPEEWIKRLEGSEELIDVAEKLYEKQRRLN
ncbi:MAG: ADP-ribosylglycohydrolase family protein [archaeon]